MNNHELIARLKAVSKSEQDVTLEGVFLALCESIDSPRSLSCSILFSAGEHDQLLALEVDPLKYDSVKKFADDYFITKFLSKYPHLKVSFDPEQVALDKFLECEEKCREVNKTFASLSDDPSKWDPELSPTFRRAKRIIFQILGRPNLEKISASFGWGPGATSAASGTKTTAYDKFQQKLDVTSNSHIMAHCCVNSTPAWVNCQLQTDEFPSVEVCLTRDAFNVVRGNDVVFVPKNAKTHRVIAIEPHVNSYLQKGFGGYIRKRLRLTAGVDLDDQSINQRLACEGSLTGALATIDLSSASDTISTELVRWLLPADWFLLLDMIRCKQGFIRKTNQWIHYNKFSSMGNGFTFELESLIFYALCKACTEIAGEEDALVSVMGDDLIVGSHHFDSVARVLNFAGFSFNYQKSFSTGLFRESCGKDYFFGVDVRPLFLKERIANVESIYKLANGIRRYSHRRNSHCGCDWRFRSAWLYLYGRLEPDFRTFWVPEGFGDGGLVGNFDEATPKIVGRRLKTFGWQGWEYTCIQRRPLKKVMRDRHGGYTTVLSASGLSSSLGDLPFRFTPFRMLIDHDKASQPYLGTVNPRDRTQPKVARGHTWVWYDFGLWS